MAGSSPSLDYWRRFFRSANSDIFQVIQKAIVVAATDHPEEFQQRRCSIAETLFTQRRVESEAAELRVVAEDKDDDGSERDEHKANEPSISGRDEDPNRSASKYSYHEAEALTDEIEEENQIVGEVLRIKKLLENHQEESDGVLFESLRRLQLMQISVKALQATEIGIAVGGLKRHNSKKIRHLVRTLIGEWKAMVEQWMSAAAVITENAATAVTDGTPDSVIISTGEEDEGLAFPPLDEGALLATHTTTIELSNFFDGMDEDGNLQPNVLNEKNRSQKPTQQNHVSERKPPINSVPPEVRGQTRWPQAEDKQKKPQDTRSMQTKQQLGLQRQPRPSNTDNKNGRSSNPVSERKGSSFGRTQHRQEPANVQRKPLPPPVQEKSKNAEDSSVKAKLEIAKRKLQEGYKQAENAKKQRTIQVMELHDLPKQGLHQQRQQHNNIKHRSKLREMLKGRR